MRGVLVALALALAGCAVTAPARVAGTGAKAAYVSGKVVARTGRAAVGVVVPGR